MSGPGAVLGDEGIEEPMGVWATPGRGVGDILGKFCKSRGLAGFGKSHAPDSGLVCMRWAVG